MIRPAPRPAAGPIQRPPRQPPPHRPPQPRRHCTVSIGVAVSAPLRASDEDSGAADAGAASNGALATIARARIFTGTLMTVTPLGVSTWRLDVGDVGAPEKTATSSLRSTVPWHR